MKTLIVALVCLAGCDGILPAPDFEQMIDQHKLKAFAATSYFSDGRAMRPPADGTIARDVRLGPPELVRGKTAAGAYVEHIPIPLDRAAIEHGRHDFETYCGVCHGLTGDGSSVVARHMELRRPPSLVSGKVVAFPVGRVFTVTEEGYGLMPSYRHQLTAQRRWQIVAYLGALQLSQHAQLAALPSPVRTDAERALATKATP
ncbi:MAG: cytochrome c [Polyangia bacterium]